MVGRIGRRLVVLRRSSHARIGGIGIGTGFGLRLRFRHDMLGILYGSELASYSSWTSGGEGAVLAIGGWLLAAVVRFRWLWSPGLGGSGVLIASCELGRVVLEIRGGFPEVVIRFLGA